MSRDGSRGGRIYAGLRVIETTEPATPAATGQMEQIDWSRPFYDSGPMYGMELEHPPILSTAVTVLIGSYLDGPRDVALISDRRSSPRNAPPDVAPVESAYKTLRLGPECAIGFSGAIPLANAVLSRLLGVQEPDWHVDLLSSLVPQEIEFGFEMMDLVDALDVIVPPVIQGMAPPDDVSMTIVIAGRINKLMAGLARSTQETQWKVEPLVQNYISSPIKRDDTHTVSLLEAERSRHACPIQKDRATIRFCADRYENVNYKYVVRRLSRGFVPETGTV